MLYLKKPIQNSMYYMLPNEQSQIIYREVNQISGLVKWRLRGRIEIES